MKLEHWIVVVFLALCAGMTGVFVAGSWSATHPVETPSSLHELVHHVLDLSAEQEAELELIERRFAARKVELGQNLRTANLALAKAMDADKSYSPTVQAAIGEIHTAMGELQKVTIEHVFEMREILTEEQAIVFDAEVVRALTEL